MQRPLFLAFLQDDRAQGLLEYALVILFVALIAIAGLRVLGAKPSNSYNSAASYLS